MVVSMTMPETSHISKMLAKYPKEAIRAAEHALDFTAKDVRDEERAAIKRVFDNPTPYTLNSLKVTPTRNHNMQASVWFKEPDRMGHHYLVPQVEGGKRKLKGFERALDSTMFIPGKGVRLNKSGNVSYGQIKQVLSVLGKTEWYAGYAANKTARSAKRNGKERDYILITQRKGRLLPGVYLRKQTGVGFGAKTKRTFADRGQTYQKGRTRGGFSSVVVARGLKPILLQGRQNANVTPRLHFYKIARAVFNRQFPKHFDAQLARRLPR